MSLSACTLGFLIGSLSLVHGSVYISQCNARGWLDVREDQTAATVLTCSGFGSTKSVSWQLFKNNTLQASSTCGPLSTLPSSGLCDTSTSDIVVLRTSNTTSSLLMTNNHRDLVGNGSVWCTVPLVAFDSCKINVITPAVLSDCEVTTTTHQTLAGTCNFNSTYSSNGTYTCTWTLIPTDKQGDPNVTIPGVIHKTPHTVSSKLYYMGTCSLTSSELLPGDYFYTVSFFPGDSDSQHQGTVTVIDPTPDTTPDLAVTTDDPTADQSSSIAAIAGGVVAGLVVIVAVVVVVLVWRYRGRRLYDSPKRRQRRQPEEHPYTGLDVHETVGQSAPSTSHVQDTAQSVYSTPVQESSPGVELSQTNTAFTPDTDTGQPVYLTLVQESAPGVELSQTNTAFTPDTEEEFVTYENDTSPGSSHPYKNVHKPDNSSHPYKNDHQPGTSSQPDENDHQPDTSNQPDENNYEPYVSSYPYQNVSQPDSSQPYEDANPPDSGDYIQMDPIPLTK